jgi:putative ABC transport system permease protein
MTPALLDIGIALVRTWTRIYTWNLEPAIRDGRRAEIESDLWEHVRGPDVRWRIALEIVGRLLLGIPDDIRWRVERVRPISVSSLRDGGVTMIAYALRSLVRTPGFTAAATLTLALGIGAATAIYSVVDAVVLRPLPFRQPEQLVSISENQRPNTLPRVSLREILEWRTRTTTLSGLTALTLDPQMMVSTPVGATRLTGGLVATNYFELLGQSAQIGRTIVPADEQDPSVILLSHEAWQKYFNRDPHVVGTTVTHRTRTSSRVLTVIGVMPPGIEQLGAPLDVYTPLVNPTGNVGLGGVIGRLREGVSIEAASQEANAIGTDVRPPRPASAPPLTGARFTAQSLDQGLAGDLGPAVRVFVAAAAAVLLIVCANVANLLLARGTARRREIAVRLALGASRGRIVAHVLSECLFLAIAGGIVGAALGAGGVALVKQLTTVEAEGVFRIIFRNSMLPRAQGIGINESVFGVAFVLAALTSLACGLLPALHLSRTSNMAAMGSRGGGTPARETKIRTTLVVAQVATASMLLVGGMLLMRSFLNLVTVDKGYEPASVLAFQLVIPEEYPTARKAETIDNVLVRVRAVPGVESVGFAYAGIMVGVENTVGSFVPPGRTFDEISKMPNRPRLKALSPGYLESVSAHLLAGRLLQESDATSAVPAVVINRTVAQRYFGTSNPVGSQMTWFWDAKTTSPVQIVGVVDDIRQGLLEREPYAEVFMDYRQVLSFAQRWGAPPRNVENLAFGFLSFAARTSGSSRAMIPAVRQAIAAVDPNTGLDAILPMASLFSNSVAQRRFYAVIIGTFATVAALLAAIGVYGVLAYAVAQRTQEIGVRVALGARRGQVMALVLRRGLLLAAVGVGIGLASAVVGARYLQGMLYGVTPLDPGTFLIVGIAFMVVAALASYLPARRATLVDPIVALRNE